MTIPAEVLLVSEAVKQALLHKKAPSIWEDSPFRWLVHLSNIRKSDAGAALFDGLIQSAFGIRPEPLRGRALRRLFGKIFKIKISLQWEDGTFAYEQIRDEAYDVLVMVGVRPNGFCWWVVPKDVVFSKADKQHAEESRWIKFRVANPPEWLVDFGGDLDTGLQVLDQVVGG